MAYRENQRLNIEIERQIDAWDGTSCMDADARLLAMLFSESREAQMYYRRRSRKV